MHSTVTYLDSADYQNDQRVGYQRTLYDSDKSRRSVDVPGEMPVKDRKKMIVCLHTPPTYAYVRQIYLPSLPSALP